MLNLRTIKMINLRITPELIFMLPFALFVDGIGVVLILVGLDDLGILDIIGIAVIGSWIFARTGFKVKISGKGKNRIFKFAGTSIGEIIPYFGALPFWTLLVLSTLMLEPNPREEDQEEGGLSENVEQGVAEEGL